MSLVIERSNVETKSAKQSTTQARDIYDPQYDPLKDSSPGYGREYAPTYWIDTAGTIPKDDGPILADISTDVVIIGSGLTGLSTAIHLAQDVWDQSHRFRGQ